MKCQNRQFTKFISLLKFPGLQYKTLDTKTALKYEHFWRVMERKIPKTIAAASLVYLCWYISPQKNLLIISHAILPEATYAGSGNIRHKIELLRFSLWLFRYFLKTYVYTPSTPCTDVKFCPNIPLGDLSWNLLTEVMWHHQINGFSNSKFWKNQQENVHVGMENDWSGSFVLLYGWNKEGVRWGFSLFKSIGKLWAILSFATSRENLDCS